jgi:hypothetical protein
MCHRIKCQISRLRQVLFDFEIEIDIAADEAWGRGYHAMGTNASVIRAGESGGYLGGFRKTLEDDHD